jgi:hypothetical protein
VTTYWFPDNTVLCTRGVRGRPRRKHSAAIDRLPLLQAILAGRGRWVEAIAYEAKKSSRTYPNLSRIRRDGWLGEPITLDAEHELAEVENIRRYVFRGRASQPLKHLGEAQTCYVIKHWPRFQDSHWITDDRDALEYASRQGITSLDTCDLIDEGIIARHLSRDEGYALLRKMVDTGRHVRLPDPRPEG